MVVLLAVAILVGCKKQSSSAGGKTDLPLAKNDPLPSWNDTKVKKSIVTYVKDVTDSSGGHFIPKKDRIAVFDNDGTLWSEQPFYFQLFFALDQIKIRASEHPEWKNRQPFKAVLDDNIPQLMKQGDKALLQIIAVSHSGMSTSKFDSDVKAWISKAKHPSKKKLFKDLIYQPMLELVNYLQQSGFKVFIVSGGGIDFMRAWAKETYGIPRENIIGSTLKVKYDYNNGNPVIIKQAAIDFYDDKEGKPAAIERYIGRKPVFAVGNSDGDLQMLQWTASNAYKNYELYVHHTDSVREWAYDRKSPIGALDKGLDEGKAENWNFVDMHTDWKVIYPER